MKLILHLSFNFSLLLQRCHCLVYLACINFVVRFVQPLCGAVVFSLFFSFSFLFSSMSTFCSFVCYVCCCLLYAYFYMHTVSMYFFCFSFLSWLVLAILFHFVVRSAQLKYTHAHIYIFTWSIYWYLLNIHIRLELCKCDLALGFVCISQNICLGLFLTNGWYWTYAKLPQQSSHTD